MIFVLSGGWEELAVNRPKLFGMLLSINAASLKLRELSQNILLTRLTCSRYRCRRRQSVHIVLNDLCEALRLLCVFPP